MFFYNFTRADQQDRGSNFGKNVVKAFYTSAMVRSFLLLLFCWSNDAFIFQIYDIIMTFGELSEEAVQQRKYAKWKAAYIHNCLKNGETPHAGPLPSEGDDELGDASGGQSGPGPAPSSDFGWNTPPAHQPPAPFQQPYQPPQGPYQQPPQGPYQQPYQPPAPAYNYQPDAPGSNSSLPFHLPDPPKDPEPKHPGGFVPYNPSTSSIPSAYEAKSGSTHTPEQIAKAQKYCKYTASALTYDDVPTAILNLQKCLRLLQTGEDS